MDRSVNLALGSTVDSPDDVDQDYCSGGREGCVDAWAADGDVSTYWDEVDNQVGSAWTPRSALLGRIGKNLRNVSQPFGFNGKLLFGSKQHTG